MFFNKICPKNFSGIGIALTNMLITFWAEAIQITIGAFMDWKSVIKYFSNYSGFHQNIQFACLLLLAGFIISIILILFLKIDKK